LADEAVSDVIDQLIKRAGTEIANAGIDLPSSTECQRILARFRAVVPAERCHGLSEILNAAWLAYEDPSLWSTIPQVSRSRDRNLRELVLKNIEVFEIEQILGDQP
jgi:hypothetical protein